MRLCRIIKECIDEWDPYDLLRIGCPKDEFDLESRMIAGKINAYSSEKQINEAVSAVFSYMFEPERFAPEKCADVSRNIFNAINGKYDPAIISDRYGTPFGYIEVLRNGKTIPFEISRSVFDTESFDEEVITIEGCYDIFIDYDDLKKGDEVLVRYSSGELEYDGGDENTINALSKIEGFVVEFGFLFLDNPEDQERFPYKQTSLKDGGVIFEVIDDPQKYIDKPSLPEGIMITAAWESEEKSYAERAVSYFTAFQ